MTVVMQDEVKDLVAEIKSQISTDGVWDVDAWLLVSISKCNKSHCKHCMLKLYYCKNRHLVRSTFSGLSLLGTDFP